MTVAHATVTISTIQISTNRTATANNFILKVSVVSPVAVFDVSDDDPASSDDKSHPRKR